MVPGKCPRCSATVASVDVHPLTAKSGGASFKSITFHCPSCHTILGCQVDPHAMKVEIVKEVGAVLGKAVVA